MFGRVLTECSSIVVNRFTREQKAYENDCGGGRQKCLSAKTKELGTAEARAFKSSTGERDGKAMLLGNAASPLNSSSDSTESMTSSVELKSCSGGSLSDTDDTASQLPNGRLMAKIRRMKILRCMLMSVFYKTCLGQGAFMAILRNDGFVDWQLACPPTSFCGGVRCTIVNKRKSFCLGQIQQ